MPSCNELNFKLMNDFKSVINSFYQSIVEKKCRIDDAKTLKDIEETIEFMEKRRSKHLGVDWASYKGIHGAIQMFEVVQQINDINLMIKFLPCIQGYFSLLSTQDLADLVIHNHGNETLKDALFISMRPYHINFIAICEFIKVTFR